MLVLVKDGVADSHGDNRPGHAKPKLERGGAGLEQEDFTHELQVVIHGVGIHQDAQDVGHLEDVVGGPKDRGEVGPSREHDAP